MLSLMRKLFKNRLLMVLAWIICGGAITIICYPLCLPEMEEGAIRISLKSAMYVLPAEAVLAIVIYCVWWRSPKG
jgi:hypothetical protein